MDARKRYKTLLYNLNLSSSLIWKKKMVQDIINWKGSETGSKTLFPESYTAIHNTNVNNNLKSNT